MEEIKSKNESLAEAVKQLATYMFSITGIEMNSEKSKKSAQVQKRRMANQGYAPKKCKPS